MAAHCVDLCVLLLKVLCRYEPRGRCAEDYVRDEMCVFKDAGSMYVDDENTCEYSCVCEVQDSVVCLEDMTI